jgi:hypothetical protein
MKISRASALPWSRLHLGHLVSLSCLVAVLGLGASSAQAQDAEPAPEGWTCSASYYGADDGCDCGCGIADPDCADAAVETCGYEWCGETASPNPDDTTACIDDPPPAEGWTCSPLYYGGGDGCDCGCGAVDADCEGQDVNSCTYNQCPTGQAPMPGDNARCEEGEWVSPGSDDEQHQPDAPGDWTCQGSYFGGGDGCDCGCGAVDADCANSDYDTCQFNYCPTGEIPDAGDTTQCTPGDWVVPDSSADETDATNADSAGAGPEEPGNTPGAPGPEGPTNPGADTPSPTRQDQATPGDAPPSPDDAASCASAPGGTTLLAWTLLLVFGRRRRRAG